MAVVEESTSNVVQTQNRWDRMGPKTSTVAVLHVRQYTYLHAFDDDERSLTRAQGCDATGGLPRGKRKNVLHSSCQQNLRYA